MGELGGPSGRPRDGGWRAVGLAGEGARGGGEWEGAGEGAGEGEWEGAGEGGWKGAGEGAGEGEWEGSAPLAAGETPDAGAGDEAGCLGWR